MTDPLRDLIHDAVADVEPRHALDDIRARTTGKAPLTLRWPYTAGAALAAVAAALIAFAVLGPNPSPTAIDPAGPSTGPATGPPSATAPATPSTQAGAVYFIGDTPDGLRLYREFVTVPSADPLTGALDVLFGGQPMDPDYFNGWVLDSTFKRAEVVDGVIRVEIGDPELLLEHDPNLEQYAMSIQQVIYTAQAAVQDRLPIQFWHQGQPVGELLGTDTSEPITNAPVLDTLAHVSLTSPTDGMQVDNDEPLVVEGVGNSFEGNIVTRVQRWEGTEVVAQEPTIAGTNEDKLFPFEVSLDLADVPPGDYVVISSTEDPSGQGREHTDTRRITVVD